MTDELSLDQRLELLDIELKEIGKLIEEMGAVMAEFTKIMGHDND